MNTNERPILFNAPMVRAILDGRKTQTRRVVKLTDTGRVKQTGGPKNWHLSDPDAVLACPFGQPGDRLWVRETFGGTRRFLVDHICYRADELQPAIGEWKPSIHMPRWASRITLEVTGVRVERLNEISKADACWEGLSEKTKDGSLVKYGIPDRDGWPGTDDDGWPWHDWRADPRDAFAHLWESVYGAGSWSANPWVWVVEFRRVP
jgi:hypothetical protein